MGGVDVGPSLVDVHWGYKRRGEERTNALQNKYVESQSMYVQSDIGTRLF